MARKAYSDEERAQVKEALMVTMIRCIADRGLIHSSIDVLCGKVGISKTFFYSFFSSKEELVLHALRYQQPRLAAAFPRRIFRPFDRTRSVFMGNCSPSLASLWTVLIPGCLAIWPSA